MTIRIVTDSTCDLPQDVVEENNITVIPLTIQAGGREYRDGIDLSRKDFYEMMPGFNPPATTAVPGTGIFRQTYDKLAEEGADEILSIHISTTLSAMVNVARVAAEETTSAKVTVLDSRQLSLGLGYQAFSAAVAAARGLSMNKILEIINEQISRTHVFAALETLEYLRRSGRMNFAMATIGSLLQIKPLLKMYDGKPETEKVRTRSGAIRRLIQLLQQFGPYEKVAVLHTAIEDTARDILSEISHLLPDQNTWFGEVNPVLGSHLGPGVLGFAVVSKSSPGAGS